MEFSKRLKIFLACITLGPLFGYLLTSFWFAGGGTFWQPIDYFPHPVEAILNLQPYGNEFWVTATDGATYHILYPCQETTGCWQEGEAVSDLVPSDEYVVSEGRCESDYFVYPLFQQEIKSCVTSTIFAETPQGSSISTIASPWRVSLALTEDKKLWIWQKPWNFPDRVLAFKVFFTALGLLAGTMVDTLLTRKYK